jgi:hypothetical protein
MSKRWNRIAAVIFVAATLEWLWAWAPGSLVETVWGVMDNTFLWANCTCVPAAIFGTLACRFFWKGIKI